jgi:hypothetical protein
MSEEQSISLVHRPVKKTSTYPSGSKSESKMSANNSPGEFHDVGRASPGHESEFDYEMYQARQHHQMMQGDHGSPLIITPAVEQPIGYPTGVGNDEQGKHMDDQGMANSPHSTDMHAKGLVSNTLGSMGNTALGVVHTVANVAAQRILPPIIGQLPTDIAIGTVEHYVNGLAASHQTPPTETSGGRPGYVCHTPYFSKGFADDAYVSTLYKANQVLTQQVNDGNRACRSLTTENLKVKNQLLAISQQIQILMDNDEHKTKVIQEITAHNQQLRVELAQLSRPSTARTTRSIKEDASSGFRHIVTHTIGNVVGTAIDTLMAPLRSDGFSPKRSGEAIQAKYDVEGSRPSSPKEGTWYSKIVATDTTPAKSPVKTEQANTHLSETLQIATPAKRLDNTPVDTSRPSSHIKTQDQANARADARADDRAEAKSSHQTNHHVFAQANHQSLAQTNIQSHSHIKPSAPALPNVQATPSNVPSSFHATSHLPIHPNHVHHAQPYVQPQYAHPQSYGHIPTYYPHNPQQYPHSICAMDPYGNPIMIPNPRLLGQHIPHMQTAQLKPPTYVQTPIPVAGTTGHHRPMQETPKNQNPPRPVSRPNTSLTASHVSSPGSVADEKPLLTKKESKDRSASLSKIPYDASSQASRTTGHSKHPKDDKPSKSSKDKGKKPSKNPKYKKAPSQPDPSDGSSSDSSDSSDNISGTASNYTTPTSSGQTTPTKKSRKSKRSKKVPKDRSNSLPSETNQALLAVAHALQQQFSAKGNPMEKFKMNYSFQLKAVKLSKGERITSSFIIRTLTAAKDIDIAATKAYNRKPQSETEWQIFFKFHLAHMTDVLHEEMSSIVQDQSFVTPHSFWTQVFKKIFPTEIALDAFDKALLAYMIWNEPLGLERWEHITNTLLTHKAHMQGRGTRDICMCLAEGMAQQLQRIVMACPDSHSSPLFEKYTTVYAEVLDAREHEHPITKEMYLTANTSFLRHLRLRLNTYHCSSVFGHSLAKDTKIPDHVPAQLNHMPTAPAVPKPPTYSQVTQEGGLGHSGGQAPSNPDKSYTYNKFPDKKPFPPGGLKKHAPNGNLRTYSWWQVTKPDNSSVRVPCNDPPPPEAKGHGCEYYGDWLDVQGLCSYCTSDQHKKDTCKKYQQAVARFPNRNSNLNSVPNSPVAAAAVQGNSQAPAH